MAYSSANIAEALRILTCIFVGLTLRWSVTQFPYSGEGKEPMFGDYEAQRHWMEITTQLPIEEWYVETPNNDLQYWGLDYPPLSAFHSYGIGMFFANILPESVQLFTSRGFESQEHKFWMRLSVLISDILLPAFVLYYALNNSSTKTGWARWNSLLLALMAPPFILIDYAHFQYNCVSLGLTVLAVICIVKNQVSIGAILFTFAVNHKQMSLYHALPFFVQMVATIIFKNRDCLTTFRVGITIASTLGLLWLPFGETWPNVFQRIFPIKRGVYEDKVGSFWYVLDRIIPLKRTLPDLVVAQLCLILSGLILLPGLVHYFWFSMNKSIKLKQDDIQRGFVLYLFNVSLILFMFSYHVHEKSIMLAVLPAMLMIPWYAFEVTWFTTVASLSLYPLLLEEGSHLAVICLTIIFVMKACIGNVFTKINMNTRLMMLGSLSGYVGLILGLHLVTPPQKFPHLFQSGIAIFSFIHYAGFSVYFNFIQFQLGKSQEVTIRPGQGQKKKEALKKKKKK